MFTIVMVMPCNVIGYVIFMFYFLCKMIVIIESNKFIYLGYIVCIISVNGIMLINSNIISNIIICFLYICVLFIL